MKTIEIDSHNHFQLIKTDDEVEVIQYGPSCPKLHGGEYEDRTVIARLHPQTDILWKWVENDWDKDELVDIDRVVPLCQLPISEEVVCGDDFVYDLKRALPRLTYVVFPCEDVAGDWVGHCLEFDAVSQGQTAGGAFDMVMEAARIIWDEDRKEGRNPFDRCHTPLRFDTPGVSIEFSPRKKL